MFTTLVGPPHHLVFQVQPSATLVGASIAPAVVVRIVDAAGNLTNSTATVSLAIGANPGGGVLSGTTSVAAVNGVATFGSQVVDKAGVAYTLVASTAGLSDAPSDPFNILAIDLFKDGFE
jgi:hypothetical protein